MTGPQNRAPSIQESLSEYGRGIAGGFLFSLPLLFTMEVWQAGLTVSPARLLLGLAVTLIVLCGFNAFAGLRYDANAMEVIVDSVEELGLGLALSALLLFVLGRFSDGASLAEVSGQIVLEGLFVAIGVSVGTAQLATTGDDERGTPAGRHASIWGELVLATCGAILIAANVAPTDEILRLASEMAPWQIIVVCVMSLAVATTLMYFSHFVGSGRFTARRETFSIVQGSVITYGAALATSAGLLAFFGRFGGHPAAVNVAQCIVLGFAATLGASAGRLLLR